MEELKNILSNRAIAQNTFNEVALSQADPFRDRRGRPEYSYFGYMVYDSEIAAALETIRILKLDKLKDEIGFPSNIDMGKVRTINEMVGKAAHLASLLDERDKLDLIIKQLS